MRLLCAGGVANGNLAWALGPEALSERALARLNSYQANLS
jgi:hypothetical protein